MAWFESEFEESMPNTRTQTNMHLSFTSHNLLARTYICAAKPANWGVGPDVCYCILISPQEEVRHGVPRPQGGGAAANAVPVPKVRTVGGP